MALVEDEQLVQTLGSHGSNPALRMRIRIWGPRRREDDFQAFGAENGIKCVREFAVPIVNEKVQTWLTVFHLPHKLSGLLRYPAAIQIRRAPSEMDTPASQLDEEEHIDGLQEDRLDGKEITGQDLIFVVPHPSESVKSGHQITCGWIFRPYGASGPNACGPAGTRTTCFLSCNSFLLDHKFAIALHTIL